MLFWGKTVILIKDMAQLQKKKSFLILYSLNGEKKSLFIYKNQPSSNLIFLTQVTLKIPLMHYYKDDW